MLSSEYLLNDLILWVFLFSYDPERHVPVHEVAILRQHRLSVYQTVLLLAVPEKYHLELEARAAGLTHTSTPNGSNPGRLRNFSLQCLLLAFVLIRAGLSRPHMILHLL